MKQIVTIQAKTTELLTTLKHLKVGTKGRSQKMIQTNCEITITDGKISCAVPGITFNLNCKTNGVAKVSLPFFNFYNYINNYKQRDIYIKIYQDNINIGNLTFKAKTYFFEDDKILRTIKLPLNYSDLEILRMPYQNYTQEELDFNNITPMIEKANLNLIENINRVVKILRVYKVEYDEIQDMILKKIEEN